MSYLLVAADDMTGALDTAVQFTSQGIHTVVLPSVLEELPQETLEASVVVLCAATRHLSQENAYQAILAVTRLAVRHGFAYLYKKVDSTLRGNIGAELMAMMDAAQADRVDFFPAFPQMGRTTKNGVQYLNQIPIDQSEFRHDPFEPVTESYIPAILARQTDVPVHVYRAGEKVGPLTGKHICVYDSETDQGLRQTAQEVHSAVGLRVMAGCAGFARNLVQVLSLPRSPLPRFTPPRPLLFVCGSLNPVSRRQISVAEASGFRHFALPLEAEEIPKPVISDILRASRRGQGIVISRRANGDDSDVPWMRERVASRLGGWVKELLQNGLDATLMVTGGDTLLSVIDALRGTIIHPIAELKTGVVFFNCLCNGKWIPMISKAGGFGDETLLPDLVECVCVGG